MLFFSLFCSFTGNLIMQRNKLFEVPRSQVFDFRFELNIGFWPKGFGSRLYKYCHYEDQHVQLSSYYRLN